MPQLIKPKREDRILNAMFIPFRQELVNWEGAGGGGERSFGSWG